MAKERKRAGPKGAKGEKKPAAPGQLSAPQTKLITAKTKRGRRILEKRAPKMVRIGGSLSPGIHGMLSHLHDPGLASPGLAQ